MEILSINEKIKMIRKRFKINQKDLVNSVCSRTNLSNIENGKTNVTEELAKKFCDRVNFILKEKQIQEQISFDWLIESVESQVKKYVDTLIINYVKNQEIDIDVAKRVFLKHEIIDQKIRLFAVLGSTELNVKKNYNLSCEYLEYILPLMRNYESKFKDLVLFQLQRLYIRFEQYSKITTLFSQSFINNYNPEIEMKSYILYEFALAFKMTEYYETATEIYELIMGNFSNKHINIRVKNNCAVCYNRLENFEKADKMFLETIEETDENESRVKSYTNMLFHADKRKDKLIVNSIINKIETIAGTLNRSQLFQAYYCIGKAYLDIGNRLKAKNAFEKELALGMHLHEKQFFIEKYKRAIIELLKIYNYTEKRKLENLQKKILEIPFSYLDKTFISNVLFYFNQAFSKQEMNKMYKHFKQDDDYNEF